jgi:hypothetical protein
MHCRLVKGIDVSEPYKSLSDQFRERLEARKNPGPDDAKMAWLVKSVAELLHAIKGIVWQSNLNNGNVRECREIQSDLIDRIVELEAQNDNLKAEIGGLQVKCEAMSERIENMAQWAKTKGKT